MNNKVIIAVVGIVAVIGIGALLSKSGRTTTKQEVVAEKASGDEISVKELYSLAKEYEEKNDVIKAKDVYKKIITEYPDFSEIETVQRSLEKINLDIIFSERQTPQTVIHEVEAGDTLGKLAKKYNTTVELIKKSNGLSNDTIRIGQRLRIWTGEFSVLVDKSQNILILRSDGDLVKVYDVSTGRDNNTPVGTFTIVNKLVDPVWYKSGAIVPPESPKNALGSRWLGFDIPGYGIHGTIEPQSIGMQVTEGCVRMRNEDVEELYSLLPIGTKVTVVD